jgi:hypothetical protein
MIVNFRVSEIIRDAWTPVNKLNKNVNALEMISLF